MMHPWKEISLEDYENHMQLKSVQQLQTMNAMMADQLYRPGAETVMILGAAGGNGLEHADPKRLRKIFAVDINPEYLQACAARFPELEGALECLCGDLSDPGFLLPHADTVIANLVVEYIGYPCFQRVLLQVRPTHISCGIQVNTDESFVSDSPYHHSFDRLAEVHHQMAADTMTSAMKAIGYRLTSTCTHPLPNGKQLVQLDYINIMKTPFLSKR